jgi:hypothetical protein
MKPSSQKSIIVTVYEIFTKLSIDFSAMGLYIKKNFHDCKPLTIRETSRDQGAKLMFHGFRYQFSLLQAAALGLVSFERRLSATSDERKDFFNF